MDTIYANSKTKEIYKCFKLDGASQFVCQPALFLIEGISLAASIILAVNAQILSYSRSVKIFVKVLAVLASIGVSIVILINLLCCCCKVVPCIKAISKK